MFSCLKWATTCQIQRCGCLVHSLFYNCLEDIANLLDIWPQYISKMETLLSFESIKQLIYQCTMVALALLQRNTHMVNVFVAISMAMFSCTYFHAQILLIWSTGVVTAFAVASLRRVIKIFHQIERSCSSDIGSCASICGRSNS